MITLEQFKNETLGKSIGNPGTGTYVGECVSYVRQYMEQVLGIKTIVNGHAVSYYNSAFMAQHFDKVPMGQEQNGDILCWGDDPGSWTTSVGHIAIRYAPGQILNQNFGGNRKVTINPFFSPGYQGALRLKQGAGSMAGIDATDLTAIYELGPLGRSRSPGEGENVYVGKTANFVLRDHRASAEGQQRAAALAAKDVTIKNLQTENASLKASIVVKDKEIAALKAQVANSGTGIDQATKDKITETNTNVSWIKDLLSRVFK